jgi:hypothetical protein
MSLIKAVDPKNLLPLRSPWNEPRPRQSLLANHQTYHHEPRISPTETRHAFLGASLYWNCFGAKVFPTREMLSARNYNPTALNLPPSEIAAKVLEVTFLDVSWDKPNDRTVVTAKERFKLSGQGTNVVEMAVLLPLLYKLTLEHASKIKQGIGWVEAAFTSPKINLAQAGGSLQIKITVPGVGDQQYFNPRSYCETVTKAFLNAISPFLST